MCAWAVCGLTPVSSCFVAWQTVHLACFQDVLAFFFGCVFCFFFGFVFALSKPVIVGVPAFACIHDRPKKEK